jgi:hypothetical protein
VLNTIEGSLFCSRPQVHDADTRQVR